MSKKNHSPGPVPPGNQPHAGTAFTAPDDEKEAAGKGDAPADQEQDAKRRLGDFTGKGEHSIQQPGRLNDG